MSFGILAAMVRPADTRLAPASPTLPPFLPLLSAPMPADAQSRFLRLLKQDILKLDLADLDFGVYRILAHRRGEIERFFDETLPAAISEALASGGADRTKQIDERLATLRDELTTQAQALGLASAFDDEGRLAEALQAFPKGKTYVELAEEKAAADAGAGFEDTEEATIFAHLYAFFSRYYRDGDFLPQPRRGRKAQFSVPYQGEDVHFSWRGRGNHYIKTAEELAQYTFTVADTRVRFELVQADQEENNVKGTTRYFLPLPDQCRTEDQHAEAQDTEAQPTEDGAPPPLFVVPFAFRPLTEAESKRFTTAKKSKDADADTLQQAALDEATPALLDAAPDALKTKEGTAALQRHLRRYAKKNRTDYFVHPDLGGFLRAELTYFLKNEVLDADALLAGDADGLAGRLAQARVVRDVAERVIALLHQVEDVQARLFEKRKLVLQADYLAPVFALPEALHADIIASNRQRAAWADLFGVDLGADDVAELRRRPTLVVDTAHFDADFKARLLASFDDLDEALGGVLVHSENYAALRTLGPVYEGRVQTIYIDPPYNTGSDGFLYKDDFSQHSTWLTMMEERLRLGREWLANPALVFVSIDDNESLRLGALLEAVYGVDSFMASIMWQKRYVSNATAKYMSDMHDYVYAYGSGLDSVDIELWDRTAKQLKAYDNWDNDDRGPWRAQDLSASKPYSAGQFEITTPTGMVVTPPPGRYWRCSREKYEELLADNRITFGKSGEGRPMLKAFLSESQGGVKPHTWWTHKFAGHNKEAKLETKALFGQETPFGTPKPVKLIRRLIELHTSGREMVLDYFAGSGTTGQAVIAKNREDGGSRCFLLVEQGEYADTVLMPRIQKVMHAPDWKDGAPGEAACFDGLGTEGDLTMLPDWVGRTPRLVQVLRLESYEGSLNALETPAERTARQQKQAALFGDDYLLRYFLPLETADSAPLLNLQALADPFAYRLRVHTPDGVAEQPVDLVETFPLVMGLRPVRRWTETHAGAMPGGADRPYTLMEAKGRDDGLVLVVWRPVAGLDPAAEKAWLAEQLSAKGQTWDAYGTVWMNAQGALPKGRELDTEFRRALLARDPHVRRALPSGDGLPTGEIAQLTA